jgi:transcriptional regulator with XRE-family HTH domain
MRPSRNQPLVDALAVEVKARRAELGYTQEDLAGRCELDRPFISLIEVGRKQPTVSVLYALARGLGLSFGEFADRIERRHKRQARTSARSSQSDR